MPKERRVNSSSFDRAMTSPYSYGSKVSGHDVVESSSPHVGDEREWEEARCPICMEHPHNAVLLRCSSQEKGCSPFICDTSYRHSNCLDQFLKSAAAPSVEFPLTEQQSRHVCPLCRGAICGWDVIQPARRFMNSKTRSCSLETCSFSGNYAELRKHARLKHPSDRPSEASPTRQSNWAMLEQLRGMEDSFAHQLDIDYHLDGWPSWWDEWDEDALWCDGSFVDFPSGMSDMEDESADEMFMDSPFLVLSLLYSSAPDENMMDSSSSIRSDRLQTTVSANSGSRSNNRVGNSLPRSRSRPIYPRGNVANISRPRSNHRRENNAMTFRSTSSYRRDHRSDISRAGAINRRQNAPTSFRARSSYPRGNNSIVSSIRSSYHREHAPARSRTRASSR